MNMNWLNTVRYVLRGLGALLFFLAIAAHSLPWLLGLLAGLALSLMLLSLMLYHPPEDHLGVVMRWDRFSRWVRPGEWTLLLPLVDCLTAEINLQPRLLSTEPYQAQTEEHIKVWVTLHVNYQFDPRPIRNRQMRNRLLRFSTAQLEEAMSKTVEGILHPLLGGAPLDRLYRDYADGTLARALSARVALALLTMGLTVDPVGGVLLHDLWIEEDVRQAMLQRVTAHLQGQGGSPLPTNGHGPTNGQGLD